MFRVSTALPTSATRSMPYQPHPALLRRRVPRAAAPTRRRLEEAAGYGCLLTCVIRKVWRCAGSADRREHGPLRHLLRRQAGRAEQLQHRKRPGFRRHDVGREGCLHLLQRRAHRSHRQGRPQRDHRRCQGAGGGRHAQGKCRPEDGADLLRAGAQEPARGQYLAGRQVLRLRRQAVADRHGHRACPGVEVVRR